MVLLSQEILLHCGGTLASYMLSRASLSFSLIIIVPKKEVRFRLLFLKNYWGVTVMTCEVEEFWYENGKGGG